MHNQFTTHDIGCLADGSFGHEHVRKILASLMDNLDPVLALELEGIPSDDFREEDDALDILNTRCTGVYIAFRDGDLLCISEEEDRDE